MCAVPLSGRRLAALGGAPLRKLLGLVEEATTLVDSCCAPGESLLNHFSAKFPDLPGESWVIFQRVRSQQFKLRLTTPKALLLLNFGVQQRENAPGVRPRPGLIDIPGSWAERWLYCCWILFTPRGSPYTLLRRSLCLACTHHSGVESKIESGVCPGWLARMLAGEKVESFVAVHNAILQLLKVT